MDHKEKLNAIQEQKRKLKAKLEQINSAQANTQAEDPELERMLMKKKELDEQRQKQNEYLKLEKEYNQRKKQIERQKQLDRIKNQKRVLELEVAMKRAVFQGIKQKVKGMNSEQIMRPNFLTLNEQSNANINSEDGNFKIAFEGYLLNEAPEKQKPKYDISKLNEERLVFFEKKQQVIMRQLLLKDLAGSDEPIDIDVFSLNRQQLQDELEARGINYEEFMHPIKKEQIIEQYPQIEKEVHNRITQKRKQLQAERDEQIKIERQRRAIREQVSNLPFKDVQVVKRLLYDLFDQICKQYEKRHVPLSKSDQEQRYNNLQQQYEQLLSRNLVDEMSNELVEEMMQNIRKEMLKQSAEELTKLHDFTHEKTQECFKSVFRGEDIYPKLKQLDQYKIPLLFVNQQQNEIGRPNNQKYLKKQQNEFNIYQTQDTTTSLINDITLLDTEEKYIDKINTKITDQQEYKTEECSFYYDKELYAINRNSIRSVKNNKVIHHISPAIDSVGTVRKMNRVWMIQNSNKIVLITPWGKQEFGNQLGDRISNPSGIITHAQIYPVQTLLGHPCSALLGFEKGQILKFNYNRNRLTARQTNITHYLPVIEHAKAGDEPAFPLNNRNYLTIQQEKPKPTDQIHQYRQFFEHHTEPIIFVGFYHIDKMISIDRGLKCALWEYSKGRGGNNYEPVFKFQIKSTYQIYNQDQNPRYKDIYPTSKSEETPQQMYKKYMLTEAFLKMQLYNNPKKQIAYFLSPNHDKEGDQDEKPIWKVTYKQSRGQVNKILQSYYNIVDGRISAQQAQIQGDSVIILCEREHVIRNDLKTIKLYSWNISEKRLGKIGIEIDMFKDQKVSSFAVLPNQFRGAELELVLIVNSGRLLLFSLISGQLLRNINEELADQQKYKDMYFKSIIRAPDQNIIYGATSSSVVAINWQDNNTINDRNKLNKTIDAAKRKYFR